MILLQYIILGAILQVVYSTLAPVTASPTTRAPTLAPTAYPTESRVSLSLSSAVDYLVNVYYCDLNRNAISPPLLSQGDLLVVCVKVGGTVTTDVHVHGIQEINLDQGATHSSSILNQIADPLTSLSCVSGICRVSITLESKWFQVLNPSDLVLSGTAILNFGSSRRRALLSNEEFTMIVRL